MGAVPRMQVLLTVYPFLYAAGIAGLLWVVKYRRRRYTLAKSGLSLLFLLAALLAHFASPVATVGGFISLFCALALCALGDVMLALANRRQTLRVRPFTAGVFSFSLAHILFCVLFARYAPFRVVDIIPSAALVAVLWLLERKKWVRLRQTRMLVYFYSVIVGLMLCKALQASVAMGLQTALGVLTAAGAVLFVASDMVLLFVYFGVRRIRALHYCNLGLYYTGVFLFALSAYWY